ncbi:conserved Plasmodium protein, unknown function [Plasmodium knowlesi strain H]|uniref:Uncharacterized protein n=3 Tax=Plasmodium knowlesi TaxID=5850 RepID=A0A5K1UZ26_PLAKH|nr:conserved Plasmodium protein, unknown function [Plasmodium knowlesi strain H]OTN64068.1 Uncharacterized protein PKNOH_S140223300 [Plasmodium knowlesi]CAA9990661.1 conserved Plasmodium protein, unknown function [Plasmodium knowlesi strain H]SBO25967.1 conserved Plasmodium protein, unknown function [Plasmodium knowlesi strain H]SBO28697.1 conserved Plasmodium protein, unknown function [Plasmodium knowlesi strain H]VVS80135.1 conserved Plasmodium protein, unknown function [Plasmodium knowlesi |eukprot:XP_002261952.1 hypothetical protein, conserved in Plasmodium species [Plasmodium knowlesi strain H]
MDAPPEMDLFPLKGNIEQGNHPPCLKKKNSKIISYLKNESKINVLLSKVKEKNGVNFLKNNQCGKFSLKEDKRKEVILCNHLSNLSYTQTSEKGINEKKGEIYMYRKYASEHDNTPMSSPPGKKKRTKKSTLLHRLVTLPSGVQTQKADAQLNRYTGEVKKNDVTSEGGKIITHEYKFCKMKAKKYSTLKYNIFVKGLKNVDNGTEERNTSFPREEPAMISNKVNCRKIQHAERSAKFNCDDLLQIYEHRYLRHIFRNSKNVPSHKEIKQIYNTDYVQSQNRYNSKEQQLTNGKNYNNLDKSETGINDHHNSNHILYPSDGKYGKDTILKRNINDEITTPGDCTHSRYSSCHSNGVNNAQVKSNTADDPINQIGSGPVKNDNAIMLSEKNTPISYVDMEDPHRSDNLEGEKIPNDGESDFKQMGNSCENNTEKENKNILNYSNVYKPSDEEASPIEPPQNGKHKKNETLTSTNSVTGESLVAPPTVNKPEQTVNFREEEENPTCLLPNTLQPKKEEREKVACAPKATEKLIKNILIEELKNEIYYSIIKMEDEKVSSEYEHRKSRKGRTYKLGGINRFETPRGGSHLSASCPPSFIPDTCSSDKNKTIDMKNIPEVETIVEKSPETDNKVQHKDIQKKILKQEGNQNPPSGSKKKRENEEKMGKKNCTDLKKVNVNRSEKQVSLCKGDTNNGHVKNEEKHKLRNVPKNTKNVSTPKLVIHKIDKKNSKEYFSIKIENKPNTVKKFTLEKTSKEGKSNREKKKVHSGNIGLPQSLPPEGEQKSTVKQRTDERCSGAKGSSSTEGESKCPPNCESTQPPNCPPNDPNSALTWTTWRVRLFPLFRIEENRIYADKKSRAYTTLTDHINDIICKTFKTQKRFLIFHIILYSVNLLIFYALLQRDFLLNQDSSSNTKGTLCIFYILIAELYILLLNNAFYFFFKNQIKNVIFSLDRVNLIHIMSKLFPQYSSFFKKQFSMHEKNGNSFYKELESYQSGILKEKALSSGEHSTNQCNNWPIKKKHSVRFADYDILDQLKNGHYNVTSAENDYARYASHNGEDSTTKNALPMNGENLFLSQTMKGTLIHSLFNASNTTSYGTYSKQAQPHNSLTGQGNYRNSLEQTGQNDKIKYFAPGETHTNKSTENEQITNLTLFILNEQKKNIPNQFFFFKLREYFNLLIILFASLLIHTTIFLEIKDPFHFHVKTNLFFFIFVSFIIFLQVLISIMAEIEEIFIQKIKMLLNKRVTFLDYQLVMYLGLKH